MNRITKGMLGGVALVGALSACGPPSITPPPAFCGQTIDGTAYVVLAADQARCVAPVGVKRIVVDELCGPLMPGTNVADDCWRGNLTKVAGRTLYGPVIVRLGTFNQPGDVAEVLVASDGTAP